MVNGVDIALGAGLLRSLYIWQSEKTVVAGLPGLSERIAQERSLITSYIGARS